MLKFIGSMILMFWFSASVFAAEEAFNRTVFDQLQQQGQPILVSIYADWCATCRTQAIILNKLLDQDEFKPIHALRVDFDQQQAIVKTFKVSKLSTQIVFKGAKEIDRSLGLTNGKDIAALLRKAL